jgi:hypothetical protein
MNNQELLGALVRGYCTKRNSQKVLDSDLIQDMAREVEKLATPLEPIDENKLLEFLDNWGYRQGNMPVCDDDDFRLIAHAIASRFGVSNKLEPLDREIKWVGGIGWFKSEDSWWMIRKTPYKEIPIIEVNWKEQFGTPTKKEE